MKIIDKIKKIKTMHEIYGEPNDKFGKHKCCPECGKCINCGDCDCVPKPSHKKFMGEWIR